MTRIEDLTDKRFGNWTVLRYSHYGAVLGEKKRHYWLCRCLCGTEKVVEHHALRYDRTHGCRSCASSKAASIRLAERRRAGSSRGGRASQVAKRKLP